MIMFKVCRTCGKEKNISQFHNLKISPDGKSYHCKICVNQKSRDRKKYNYKRTTHPRLTNVTKKDFYFMFRFLEQLGYDLTRPIHEQFCEKHNLTPKRPLKVKDKRYTWDEVRHLETI